MSLITIRNAAPEDAPMVAMIVFEALDIHIEPPARVVGVCAESGVSYSWENTRIVMVDGKAAGGLISYPGDDYQRLRDKTWTKIWDEERSDLLSAEPECSPGEYYLDSMALLPQYRGLGLGKKLVLDSIAVGRSKGYKRISLIVDKHKEGLVALYGSLGFEISGSVMLFGHDYWKMAWENAW